MKDDQGVEEVKDDFENVVLKREGREYLLETLLKKLANNPKYDLETIDESLKKKLEKDMPVLKNIKELLVRLKEKNDPMLEKIQSILCSDEPMNDAFSPENINFISLHKNEKTQKMEIGSIYYNNDANARIRLSHKHGPSIKSHPDKTILRMCLTESERKFVKQKREEEKKKQISTKDFIKAVEKEIGISEDVMKSDKFIRYGGEGRTLFEVIIGSKKIDSTHPSRGGAKKIKNIPSKLAAEVLYRFANDATKAIQPVEKEYKDKNKLREKASGEERKQLETELIPIEKNLDEIIKEKNNLMDHIVSALAEFQLDEKDEEEI